MKSYLMIDTAEGTRALLFSGGEYYYDENLKNAGSETLMPMIDGLLKKAGATLNDIDIFGACVGPGSFTGLRIGLTTIKTFCYSLGKPCFGVNNLRLNSYNNNSDKVISVADAGNKVCYVARFDGDNTLDPATCMTLDDALKFVNAHKDYAVSTDNKLAGIFTGTVGIGMREMKIAAEKHMAEVLDQKELLPLYIRKAQPERGEGDL
ncbi:MAG: tRNA (adenosine(37)-N6)-threonylcarbamoyltransferase complex dimerization subunit type 1 TsaB [Clostridiales bacterium]|nr:tRNA (adenosine(37)-N6)-threonylcarbamoyltransferase complex dimerization subunit type 1 TsaB [Clostridiales bacterium]